MHTLASPQVNLRMINVITHALRPVVYQELYGAPRRGESQGSGRTSTLNTERKEVEIAAPASIQETQAILY